jgi:hypothetical protein
VEFVNPLSDPTEYPSNGYAPKLVFIWAYSQDGLMNLNQHDFLLMGLQIVSLAVAIWLLLPDLLAGLGWTKVRGWIEGGPEEVLASPVVAGVLANQLTELGFRPECVYYERCGPSHTCREYVWYSQADRTYAAIYQLFVGEGARVSFLTRFEDGGIVFTQNYEGGLIHETEELLAGGVVAKALDEVLEAHRNRLRRWILSRRMPRKTGNSEDFLELQERFNQSVADYFRSTTLCLAIGTAGFLSIGPVICGSFLGWDSVAPWVALLAETGLMSFLRHYGASEARTPVVNPQSTPSSTIS